MENNESNEQTNTVQENNVNQNTDAEVIVESETNTVQENNVNQNTDTEVTVESETNTTVEQNNVKQKSGKKLLIIIIILVVLVALGLVGYIERDKIEEFIDSYKNKNNVKPVEIIDNEDEEYNTEVSEENGGVKKPYIISFYYGDDKFCETKSSDCNNIIKVETIMELSKEAIENFAKPENFTAEEYYEHLIGIEDYYKNKYLLFTDQRYIYLYIREEDKLYKIFNYYLTGDSEISLNVDKKTDELLGVIYENTYGGINVFSGKERKRLYEECNKNRLSRLDNYLICETDDTIKIFNIFDEIAIVEEHIDDYVPETKIFEEKANNTVYYLLQYYSDHDLYTKKIYDSNFKELLSFDYDVSYFNDIYFDNNEIYVKKDNRVSVFDKNGKLIKTSRVYDKVFQVIKKYFVAVDNGKLVLQTIDEGSIFVCDWNDTMQYSGGYENEDEPTITIRIIDNSVSAKDIWNYYKDKHSKSYYSEKSIEYAKENYSYEYGYDYTYNILTGELTKTPELIHEPGEC